MVSLEFSPTRDYDGETYSYDYKQPKTSLELFNIQQEQLQNIKELYNTLEKEI